MSRDGEGTTGGGVQGEPASPVLRSHRASVRTRVPGIFEPRQNGDEAAPNLRGDNLPEVGLPPLVGEAVTDSPGAEEDEEL